MSRTLYDKLWDDHVVYSEQDGTATLYIDRHLLKNHFFFVLLNQKKLIIMLGVVR